MRAISGEAIEQGVGEKPTQKKQHPTSLNEARRAQASRHRPSIVPLLRPAVEDDDEEYVDEDYDDVDQEYEFNNEI